LEGYPLRIKAAGLDQSSIRAITSWRPKISLVEEMEKLDLHGVKVVTHHAPGYPARLKEIYDYPPVLYIRSSLIPMGEWCLQC
jgi:DNA processing protein